MYRFLLYITFSISATFVYGQDTFIYVSDAGNWSSPPWQILKYDADGSNPEVFISDSLAWPQDIVFIEDSSFVLISNLNSGKINRHDANTGNFLSTFASGLSGPTRMEIGPDGYLYVLQWNSNYKVLRFSLAGDYIDEFTTIGVPQSIGMVWDDENNLFVSSFSQKHIRKFDPAGNDLGLFIDTDLAGPTNIWFDNHGDMLVADYSGGAIKRFDSDGNFVSDYITGLSESEGIDTLANGNLLVGNGGTASVKLYDNDGAFIDDIIAVGSGGLIRPNAVVLRTVTTNSIQGGSELNFSIFPTSGDTFNVELNPYFSSNATLYVTDLSGKRI